MNKTLIYTFSIWVMVFSIIIIFLLVTFGVMRDFVFDEEYELNRADHIRYQLDY